MMLGWGTIGLSFGEILEVGVLEGKKKAMKGKEETDY